MDEMLKRVFACMGKKRGAQKKLAEHLGIHPNVITNWKNGTNKSYRGYAAEISAFYGVTVDYLLTGEEQKKPATPKGDELPPEDAQLMDLLRQADPDLKRSMIALLERSQRQE